MSVWRTDRLKIASSCKRLDSMSVAPFQVVVQRRIPDFTGLEDRIGSFAEVLETCFRFEPTSRPTAHDVWMVRISFTQYEVPVRTPARIRQNQNARFCQGPAEADAGFCLCSMRSSTFQKYGLEVIGGSLQTIWFRPDRVKGFQRKVFNYALHLMERSGVSGTPSAYLAVDQAHGLPYVFKEFLFDFRILFRLT